VVVQDRLNHASLVDGAQLAAGELVRYPHGDLKGLRRVLERNAGANGVLVVTDGVFSMEGNIVNLPAVAEVVEEFGARLMVDDAHSWACWGPTAAARPSTSGCRSGWTSPWSPSPSRSPPSAARCPGRRA
jgi:glycine C-acetyltransferase